MPMKPPMNSSGTNTAISDAVIDTIVNPISLAPSSAACRRDLPMSRWRTMFSITTIASSTTKPIEITSAISVRLSSVKPSAYITMNAPASDSGTESPAITVGATRRRNSSIVMMTRARLISSVIWTSMTDARIVAVRSLNGVSSTPSGSQLRISGSSS